MASQNDWEGEYDNGGPWSNVQYRKNRKSKGDGIEWTFLMQNISDRVTRNVLWRSFQPFGFISDVYVARKRDTRGRCFGFVRIVGVEDMKGILVKLNTIKMFDMSVSLEKYDKDHRRINYAPESLGRSVWRPKDIHQENNSHPAGVNNSGQPIREEQLPETGKPSPSFFREGRTYADLVKGNENVHGNGAKVVTVDGKGSLYPVHCIGRSIIGCTKVVMPVSKVRLALEKEDLSEVGLSYVGGLTFLLTFNDKVSATECSDSHSAFFQNTFSKFYVWNGDDIPFSRIATINISGVSFVIRDNSLFDKIGGLFGTVIQPSSFSWQNEDNSMGSIMVLTNQVSRIEEAVVIKWNEKSLIAWASDFIGISMHNLDDDSMMGDSESELESNSESDPDEDMVGDEGLEEGEIRPNLYSAKVDQVGGQSPAMPVVVEGLSGDASDPPVVNEKTQGGGGSPVTQKALCVNDNMGNQSLHCGGGGGG
ncbi:putative RNA recognition motif domain, nucleotide-binding alpha-beta plait domain superfamily [Helianthus annuus]|nr:putative RNA recognition motif domain, nucleotide-binding alpha-beta plait domain superfamily [Helianthus annuus]KAJ0851114.1 putative RNA recognition motif domain, nucleotide-binding alpha-beta plait domain superfamily [Helianthus annuus]